MPARKSLLLFTFLFLQASCAKTTNQQGGLLMQVSDDPKQRLLNRIWRVSDSSNTPAAGSIYIFLRNGTLLETSCVETYRVALWSVDKDHPNILRITEDQRPAFTVTLGQASGSTLQVHQKLLLGNAEARELTLTAIDNEFVCPDLRK